MECVVPIALCRVATLRRLWLTIGLAVVALDIDRLAAARYASRSPAVLISAVDGEK